MDSHSFLQECIRLLDSLHFWTDLGVEPSVAELLAEFGVFCHDGMLMVDRSMAGRAELVPDIEHCIITVMKFKLFSDSRWVTMGASPRAITAARMLRLDALVKMVRAASDTSDY